jgi:hypothetical protein
MAVQTDTIAGAWAAKAHALTQWTIVHMLNRSDQWAQYLPPEQRSYSRIVRIAPPKQMRGQVSLTPDLVVRHYIGANVGHLIGLHAKGVDNTARWICIDLGEQDPSAPATPAATLRAALAWYDTLKEQGFHPILEDSSGRGEYHLWVVFGDRIDAGTAWMFARTLVSNYADLSLPAAPKVYPRRVQAEAVIAKDWVRLPGRHHSHHHWSKVWGGAAWLEGADAVEAILATRTDPGHFSFWSPTQSSSVLMDSLSDDEKMSLEEQVNRVFEMLPDPTPSSQPPHESAPGRTVQSPGTDATSAPATMQTNPDAGSGEDDLAMINRVWTDLPPVVKAGIVAMVHSAQGRS